MFVLGEKKEEIQKKIVGEKLAARNEHQTQREREKGGACCWKGRRRRPVFLLNVFRGKKTEGGGTEKTSNV